MSNGQMGQGGAGAAETDELPEFMPWREVGWIFKDGEAVAIERRDDETRIRKVTL